MRFDILSLFPEYFRGPFDESILKKAQQKGRIEINLVDIRDFADNKWRKVDDRPYGGGPGMVLMPEPVSKALRSVKTPGARTSTCRPKGVCSMRKNVANWPPMSILFCFADIMKGLTSVYLKAKWMKKSALAILY